MTAADQAKLDGAFSGECAPPAWYTYEPFDHEGEPVLPPNPRPVPRVGAGCVCPGGSVGRMASHRPVGGCDA